MGKTTRREESLSFGACCVRRRPRAIPCYFRFGMDGPAVECKRCREKSCRRRTVLFLSHLCPCLPRSSLYRVNHGYSKEDMSCGLYMITFLCDPPIRQQGPKFPWRYKNRMPRVPLPSGPAVGCANG